jgi:hypothetical protein
LAVVLAILTNRCGLGVATAARRAVHLGDLA